MTETQVIKIIETWNRKVDRFTTDELPILLGYPEGTTEISMNDWFKAQQANFLSSNLIVALFAKSPLIIT